MELKKCEDWKEIGIPYIVVYKKYEVEWNYEILI